MSIQDKINEIHKSISWNNIEACLTSNIDTCLWHKDNVRKLKEELKLLEEKNEQ